MKNVIYFVAAVGLLVVQTTAAKGIHVPSYIEDKVIQAAVSKGRNLILAADLSPKCERIALTNLEAAKSGDEMVCADKYDVMVDIAIIIDTAFNSTSDLITDLNVVFNGIPSCIDDHAWWNFPAITWCLVGQVKPIWTASVHFFKFSHYYSDIFDKIKMFRACLDGKSQMLAYSAEHIVKHSKMCS